MGIIQVYKKNVYIFFFILLLFYPRFYVWLIFRVDDKCNLYYFILFFFSFEAEWEGDSIKCIGNIDRWALVAGPEAGIEIHPVSPIGIDIDWRIKGWNKSFFFFSYILLYGHLQIKLNDFYLLYFYTLYMYFEIY